MEIRRAKKEDLSAVGALLRQVLEVHHRGRPDLFSGGGKKYGDGEILAIFADDARPVFVAEEDGRVLGYAFCQFRQVKDSPILTDVKTLYLDDLCVDEAARGRGVGKALFRFVRDYARREGCHNLTLNVWSCNPGALAFYEKCGLLPQKITMETIL